MKMTFKNKNIMAYDHLCLEAEKKGGIPKAITLSQDEALDVLQEIKYLQNEAKFTNDKSLLTGSSDRISITTNLPNQLSHTPHPSQLIKTFMNRSDPFPATFKELVHLWAAGIVLFTYAHNGINVPLELEIKRRPHTQSGHDGW